MGQQKQDIEWTKVSRLLKFWVGATALRIFIDKLLALCLLEHIIYSIFLRLDPFPGANHCSDTISSASTAQLNPYLDRAPRTHTSTGYSPSPSPASRQALPHPCRNAASCLFNSASASWRRLSSSSLSARSWSRGSWSFGGAARRRTCCAYRNACASLPTQTLGCWTQTFGPRFVC